MYPSVIYLAVVNLIPLLGILFFGWSVQDILILYWCESGVIGLYNVLKMLFVKNIHANLTLFPGVIYRLFVIVFFIVHFGGFMFIHGLAILALTSPGNIIGMDYLPGVLKPLCFGIIGFFVSHGLSFIQNYLLGKEYLKSNLENLMFQPYGRVVIMHLSILFGGFIFVLFNAPVFLLVMLVVIKTTLDIIAHVKERIKFSKLPEKNN